MTLWTAACQAPLSVRFPKQEYWRGLPHPPPGDFLNPGIEPTSLICLLRLQVGSLPLVPPGKPAKMVKAKQNMGLPKFPSGEFTLPDKVERSGKKQRC